ncbi:DUF4267 domain-containing protein [Glycomyces salinus]|uniref:DUF4267 domain-containing protein n=1 Tax=Glycomyces salinus TaxID=980294 RepID=UPI0018EDB026|nr:DUF4267 domain-containing protein [Glycomyces salinus]
MVQVWLAAGLGAAFMLLGIVAVVRPRAAARGYGIAAEGPLAQSWAAAAGWRDAAAGAMILAVSAVGGSTALGSVVLAAVLIPVGDVLVLARARVRSPGSYGPHTAAAAAMTALGLWLL